jgi:FtsP/CotA-like multicopper oxidase with cupredoxin domain
VLPGPAPKEGDKFPSNKRYYEIPLAIQDRSFNEDGSLFYPDTRAFFEDVPEEGPFIPDSDISPFWNPEFFGNTIIVNGNTWPYLTVEARRYRFRLLNGCNSRFLILDFANIPGVEVWQIGNEGGFLAAPVNLTADNNNKLLMGLAERADIIVDFTNVATGDYVLGNVGPDEPFKGFNPDGTLADGEGGVMPSADPDSTGQVMLFRVVKKVSADRTTPPAFLQLPAIQPLPGEDRVRPLGLIEMMSEHEGFDAPAEAVLGVVEGDVTDEAMAMPMMWMDPVSENPAKGDVEVWEFYNTTADAHPMHIHEVAFQVVNRQGLALDENGEVIQPVQLAGDATTPEPWESGWKDTVIAYPGQVTRLRLRFTNPGQFVWHCHIVEHEDNEMMRPYRIGAPQPGQPG